MMGFGIGTVGFEIGGNAIKLPAESIIANPPKLQGSGVYFLTFNLLPFAFCLLPFASGLGPRASGLVPLTSHLLPLLFQIDKSQYLS